MTATRLLFNHGRGAAPSRPFTLVLAMMDVGDVDDDYDYDHQLFAANRHLETAVDDLTCRPNKKGHNQNDEK